MKKVLVLVLVLVGGAANAEDVVPVVKETAQSNPAITFPRGMQMGLGASATSGINGFIGYANKKFDSFWWKRLGVRFDFATTSPIKSSINGAIDSAMGEGIEIGDGLKINSGDLSANHIAAMLDFYPFGDTWFLGGLRLSGGYYSGKMALGANITGKNESMPGNPIEFDLEGQSYRYNGNEINGRANMNWNYAGPYLGTGFDLGLFWGIKIFTDFGVVFTNKTAAIGLDVPITDKLQYWSGSSWLNVEGNGALENQFNDAKTQATASANDDLSKIKFYPMVKLGLMYRF
jgi:hypothetical protein